MIKNFIYPAIIGALIILLLVVQCNRSKSKNTETIINSLTIDSLTAIINEYANKQPEVKIDTVIKVRTIYLTKTITKPIYVDSSFTPPIQEYTYANGKDDVVVLDTLKVRGEILSHTQAIYITDTCKNKIIVQKVPYIDTVRITEPPIIQEYKTTGILVGVESGTDNMNNIAPTIGLQTKNFTIGVSKPLLTDEFRFSLQIPITKRRLKRVKQN